MNILRAIVSAAIAAIVGLISAWVNQLMQKKSEDKKNSDVTSALEAATTAKEREDAAKKVADNW